MDLRALAKSSLLYTIGNLATRIAGFLMIPVYTRFLSTADYGIIELADLLISVSAIALGLQAMGSALIRIYHDQKDEAWQRSVVSSAIIVMSCVSTAIALLGVVLSPWLAKWVLAAPEYTTLLQVTFLTLVLGNIQEVCLTYLRIKDRPLRYVLFSMAHLVLVLGLNIYLIVFRGMGVWGFVLSKLIAGGVGALYLSTSIYREVRLRWNPEAVRRMMRFGGPLVIAGMATFALHFVDRFILNFYTSLDSVGIYALAYKFGFLITYLVGGPFHRAWNAQLYAHTDEQGWQARFAKVLSVLLFLLLFAWTGLSALVDEALFVMADPAFHAAAAFVPVIALGYVARTIGDFFRTIVYINKRSVLATNVAVACAVLNVGLNFLLIPTLGIWGSAWATLATWFSYMAAMWHFAQREHRLPIPYRNIGTLVLVAAGLYLASRVVTAGPLAVRILLSVVLSLLFPLGAWVLFTQSQKEAVRRLFAR